MLTIEQARDIARDGSIPEPNTGCWLWLGNTAGKGYPIVQRNVYVCRALLGLTDRRIEALHHCDTPSCVNEVHLFRGTQRQNMHDMLDKRRGKNDGAHCKHGHPFTRTNTRMQRRPGNRAGYQRVCRTCEYNSTQRKRGTGRRRHLTFDG